MMALLLAKNRNHAGHPVTVRTEGLLVSVNTSRDFF